jgi:hypothetical protein
MFNQLIIIFFQIIISYFHCFREFMENFYKLIEKFGADCWWELPIEKLVGKKLLTDLNLSETALEKGKVK